MGFQHVDTRQLCTRPDESVLHGHILAMKAADFQARRGAWDRVTVNPVVTIAGMPGSGSEALGRDVAALIGARFMDEELTERVAGRLKRTVGELESLEAGVTSVWARLLTALMAPWERYGAIDATFAWPYDPYPAPDQHLTKEQYEKGVKSVVCELATQGNVVLHGGASDLFVPPSVDVIRVFVEESYDRRLRRFGTELGIGTKEAEIRLARADGHVRAVSSHLFGRDLLDMDRYDLVVNMARMPHETAAGVVAAAFEPAAAVVPVPGGALVG
jgi:cytidylate kinase